jgi:hypothetical protein
VGASREIVVEDKGGQVEVGMMGIVEVLDVLDVVDVVELVNPAIPV